MEPSPITPRCLGGCSQTGYLICADGGSRHYPTGTAPRRGGGRHGQRRPAVLATWEAAGTAIGTPSTGKDQTDLELALERAIRDGATDILLLGALGGRLDQTLANLLILAQRNWQARIRLAEGDQVAQILLDGEVMTLSGAVGDIVSVVPLSPEVTGITYAGLEYPLEGAALRLGSAWDQQRHRRPPRDHRHRPGHPPGRPERLTSSHRAPAP
ncbi:MAG: thiamine diphosphokinase [Caldilineaceae bacterium]